MTQILSLLAKVMACWTEAIAIVASVSVASAQQSFKTPEDAVSALVSATKDNWPKGVVAVLGRDGVDIVSSGDKVADEAIRKKFLAAYDAKHQVTKEGDDKAVMIIGTEDFPFPIPLIVKAILGGSTRPLAVLKFCIGASAATNSPRFRLALLMSTRRTNTPRKIEPVSPMRSALSASPARRTDFTGRERGAMMQARSASWSRTQPMKATLSAAAAHRSTATTSRS